MRIERAKQLLMQDRCAGRRDRGSLRLRQRVRLLGLPRRPPATTPAAATGAEPDPIRATLTLVTADAGTSGQPPRNGRSARTPLLLDHRGHRATGRQGGPMDKTVPVAAVRRPGPRGSTSRRRRRQGRRPHRTEPQPGARSSSASEDVRPATVVDLARLTGRGYAVRARRRQLDDPRRRRDGPHPAGRRATPHPRRALQRTGRERNLYIARAFISDISELIAVRRKLKPPTSDARSTAKGDGSDLQVHDTTLGSSAGSTGQERQLTRNYAMYSLGERIHVASGPASRSAAAPPGHSAPTVQHRGQPHVRRRGTDLRRRTPARRSARAGQELFCDLPTRKRSSCAPAAASPHPGPEGSSSPPRSPGRGRPPVRRPRPALIAIAKSQPTVGHCTPHRTSSACWSATAPLPRMVEPPPNRSTLRHITTTSRSPFPMSPGLTDVPAPAAPRPRSAGPGADSRLVVVPPRGDDVDRRERVADLLDAHAVEREVGDRAHK
ncbi:hypothetical protein HBB16_10795 [Pseudonocardia sp. MCCB 268]|nr:hypothetical protein [Pseudonocardia cytotoxica]